MRRQHQRSHGILSGGELVLRHHRRAIHRQRRSAVHTRRTLHHRRRQHTTHGSGIDSLVLVATRRNARRFRQRTTEQSLIHRQRLPMPLRLRLLCDGDGPVKRRSQRVLRQPFNRRSQNRLGGKVAQLQTRGQRLARSIDLHNRMARVLQQRHLHAFGAVRNETANLEEVALQTLLGRWALTPVPAQQPPEQLLQLVVQLILLQFIQSTGTHFAGFVPQGLQVVRVLVHRLRNDVMIPLFLTQRHDSNPQEEPTIAVATNSGS